MDLGRDRQYAAIEGWLRSQGLPEEYQSELQDSLGARDLFRVTYGSGEVLLSLDPVSSPQPSVLKMPGLEGSESWVARHGDEDDFGLSAEQLIAAVKGFIARSTSKDREEIEKDLGTAAELAEKLEAMMPHPSSPSPEVGPDGRAVLPEGFHAVAGNLELEYQARARERQQAAFKSVVENAAGLTGAILNYIESFR